MALYSGSFALTKYRLLVSPKETPFDFIAEKLQKNLISPIGVEDSKEESMGFCHPFTGEPKIDDVHSLLFHQALVAGIRMDKKKIPSTFLRLQLMNAYQSLISNENEVTSSPKKLSKKMKDVIRDKLKEELLKITLPNIRIIEFVWHTDTNEIWFLSASRSVRETFEKFFYEVFEHHLMPITPGTACVDFDRLHLGLEENLKPLLDLEPIALFHGEKLGIREKTSTISAPF